MPDLTPDSTVFEYTDYSVKLAADLAEGVAYFALTMQKTPYDADADLVVSFDPRSDVPQARKLGELLIAWADAWQDEHNRFTWAPPCGINLHPDATPNPNCPGVGNCHDKECEV